MVLLNLSVWFFILGIFNVFGMPAASTGIRAGPPARCHFRHSVFRQGDAWHAKIQHSGRVYCLTCKCFKDGREQCRSQRCPESCQLSPACCPICNSPDNLTADGNCLHDGVVYREGEAFASSNGTFAYSAADQCIQCICQDGILLCDVLNCSTLSCLEKAQMPSQCCPQCNNPLENILGQENLKMMPPTPFHEKEAKGCYSGGLWYKIGSKWQPRMGPFGPLPCVQCYCTELSVVKCRRLASCSSTSDSDSSSMLKETSQLINEVADEASSSPLPETAASAEVIFRCVSEARQLLAYNSYLGKTNITELYEMVFDQMISRRSSP